MDGDDHADEDDGRISPTQVLADYFGIDFGAAHCLFFTAWPDTADMKAKQLRHFADTYYPPQA